jgi:hypothetical protein
MSVCNMFVYINICIQKMRGVGGGGAKIIDDGAKKGR